MPELSPEIEAEYLVEIFKPKMFKPLMDRAIRTIQNFEKDNPFDGIAFSGVSGAALAFPISLLTGKHLICVRKERSSHSDKRVLGLMNAQRYIIVDDQIDSGETLFRIRKEMAIAIPEAKLIGVFIWGYIQPGWAKDHKDFPIIRDQNYPSGVFLS